MTTDQIIYTGLLLWSLLTAYIAAVMYSTRDIVEPKLLATYFSLSVLILGVIISCILFFFI